MKLTSEYDRRNVEEDCDIGRRSGTLGHNHKWNMQEEDIKVRARDSAKVTEEDGNRSSPAKLVDLAERDDSMENLVKGVTACCIQETGDAGCPSLSRGMEALSLNGELSEGLQKPLNVVPNRQPKEVDERGEETAHNDERKEVEKEKSGDSSTKANNILVKLEAPSCEDNEAYATEEDPSEDSTLIERGPLNGEPANYNPALQYIANKSYVSYRGNVGTTGGVDLPPLPDNFPNYSQYQTVPTNGQLSEGANASCPKRGMEEREMHYEPQKYTRPQNNAEDASWMYMMNNLNGPGLPPSVVSDSMATAGTMTKVCHRQMSGGTMYTSGGTQLVTNLNIGHGEDNMILAGSEQVWDPESMVKLEDHLDSLEIPTNWEIGNTYGEDGSLIDKLFFTNNSNGSQQDILDVERPHQINSTLHGPQPRMVQGSYWPLQSSVDTLPAAGMACPPYTMCQLPDSRVSSANGISINNPLNTIPPHHTHQQLQKQQRLPYMDGPALTAKLGNSYEDMGYGSDQSPSHETQFSPSSSPESVMMASPAPHSAAMPCSNYSPPPSNISVLSGDSGICSPMSDDYVLQSSQVKNLRHLQVVTASPKISESEPPEMIPAGSQSPGSEVIFRSDYIDMHQEELNDALITASQDLMEQKKRKEAEGTGVEEMRNNIAVNGVTAVTHSEPKLVGNIPVIAHIPPEGVKQKTNTKPGTRLNPGLGWKEGGSASHVASDVPVTHVANKFNARKGPQGKGQGSCNPTSGGNKKQTAPVMAQQQQPSLVPSKAGVNTSASCPVPAVNKEGKIAIPPLQKPRAPAGQTNTLFMVSTGVTPVLLMTPTSTAKTKCVAILPKVGNGSGTDVESKSAGGSHATNSVNAVSTASPQAQPIAAKKRAPVAAVASHNNQLNLARRLVATMRREDDLVFKDQDGDTYMHVAICTTDRFMVQALLERLGRENLTYILDVQNNLGQTPLYLAVSTNNPVVVQLLVNQGADVNQLAQCESSTGMKETTAAIHCASSKGDKYLETLKALLKAPDINLNLVNSDGHTALHCAILAHGKRYTQQETLNSIPILQALIHAGANVNLQVQKNGKTALMYALESRDLHLIQSIFQLIEPSMLPTFLKTQAFDGSTCSKIAEALKPSLHPVDQQRLHNCLKASHARNFLLSHASSSPSPALASISTR